MNSFLPHYSLFSAAEMIGVYVLTVPQAIMHENIVAFKDPASS
jgi:hypothetical protein